MVNTYLETPKAPNNTNKTYKVRLIVNIIKYFGRVYFSLVLCNNISRWYNERIYSISTK